VFVSDEAVRDAGVRQNASKNGQLIAESLAGTRGFDGRPVNLRMTLPLITFKLTSRGHTSDVPA